MKHDHALMIHYEKQEQLHIQICKFIVRKWDVGVWTGFILLRIGTGGGDL